MIDPEVLVQESRSQQVDTVKKKYRSLSKLYHPDRSASDSNLKNITTEAQKRLTTARDLIIQYIQDGKSFTSSESHSAPEYTPSPPPPPPEIVPGVWVSEPDYSDPTTQIGMGMVQMTGGMKSANMYVLAPNNEFVGRASTQTWGMQTDIKVAGNWSYDTFNKILTLQGFSEVNANVDFMGLNFGNMQMPRQPFRSIIQIIEKAGPNKYLVRDQMTQQRSYFRLQEGG